MKGNKMDEERVKEIHTANEFQFALFNTEELREADQWIKDYALRQLSEWLKEDGRQSTAVGAYITLMVRCHYGSAETDEFLRTLGCYPSWMEA